MIPKSHDLSDFDDLKRLWYDVYDGPVRYSPLSVFEQLQQVEDQLQRIYALATTCEPDHYNETMTAIIEVICRES